jgi:hypothetical protein
VVRRVAAAALAGGALAVAAPAAQGRPLVQGLTDPAPEVQLARGGVAFADTAFYRSSDSGQAVIKLAVPGRRTRVLTRIVPTRPKGYPWPSFDWNFAVSSRATVTVKEEITDEPYYGDEDVVVAFSRQSLAALAPNGRQILRTSCKDAEQGIGLALDEAMLASYVSGCGVRGLSVRDLSDGGRIVRFFADGDPDTELAAIAGRLVAYPSGENEVKVVDWRTGALLYRAQRPGLDPYEMSLSPEGTLVTRSVADPTGCDPAVVFEPSDPVGRELPQEFCGVDGLLALAGRELAFVSADGAPRLRLVVANIDTGAQRVVAESSGIRGFDFDGSTVAWQEQRCHDFAIFRQSLTAATHPAGSSTCPIVLDRRPVRMSRRGIITVGFRCPRGCMVEGAHMTAPRLGYGIFPADGGYFRPGSRGRLRFEVDRSYRGRVRRLGDIRAVVEATSYLPSTRRAVYRRRLLIRGRPGVRPIRGGGS